MLTFDEIRSLSSLIWWLGIRPGIDDRPGGVWRREVNVPGCPTGGPFRAWMYGPNRRVVRGAYFVIQGLHYAGPSDPRMDRFLMALAAAGNLVYAPFIPEFINLSVRAKALEQTERAFAAMLNRPELPNTANPGVFSISFGSLLALKLAANSRLRHRVGCLVVFGGYADWQATIRFSVTGAVGDRHIGAHDPLNQPVVYLNYIDVMPGAPSDTAALSSAWRGYIEDTWGRDEMKRGGYRDVAMRWAEEVPPDQRRLFMSGCGLEPKSYELVVAALSATPERNAFLDPRPVLADIDCPVHLFHGRDDDVIPFTQLAELAAAMPPQIKLKTYLTGLYGHTGGQNLAGTFRHLPLLAREVRTMGRMVWTLMRSARERSS